jgi:exonuclease SbcC
MNVRKLTLRNFTTHDKTEIEFPDVGLLLVTGENGAGKSSIVEGVAWGGWGKTLRGDVPWRDDAKEAPCRVVLDTDDFHIVRGRKGGKSDLEWTCLSGEQQDAPGARSDDPEYETPTKAQEALAAMLGSFDLWRRSHVFSSADAAHFTLATDAERKRLIETFLGNDRFDPALKKCRDDLKRAELHLAELQRSRDVAVARLDAAKTRVAETKAMRATMGRQPDPPEDRTFESTASLDKKIQEADGFVAKIRAALREADRAGAGYDATARQAKEALARLRGDACPTCAQPIPEKLRSDLKKKATKAEADAQAVREKAAAERVDAEQSLARLEADVKKLRDQRATLASEVAAHRAASAAHEKHAHQAALLDKQVESARADIQKYSAQLVDTEEQIDEADADVCELAEVERVLGMKGVRAHILGRSLSGIEAVANSWIARMHPEASIALQPYSEKGAGESISLTIQGLGRGSYKSTSAGERRRADIALLLGLAEVSGAARGQEAGTLFFDEVFDCLDVAGTEAVVGVLQELATTRAVVVITHSKALIERLPSARRVHIARGTLEG